MRPTRLSLLLAPLAALALLSPSLGEDKVWRHGTSDFGDLKYPAGFKQFDYVNPDVPKGGM